MCLEHTKNMGAVILRDEPFDTLGHDLVEMPFIWLPDDYNGPRPGYPWFEAGRMTLSAKQLAAWPPCRITPWGAEARSSNDAANVQQGASEASTGPQPQGFASADGPGPDPAAGASERARRYFDQSDGAINAAIKALRGLSNPGAVLQTLDRAFASVSAMASGSVASGRDPSGMGDNQAIEASTSKDLKQPHTLAERDGTPNPVNSRTLTGLASYYNLPGNRTANGQVFNPDAMNAVMLSVGLGTTVTVALADDPRRSIDVVVTDRGPYVTGRIIDLTPAAFTALTGGLAAGVVRVVVTTP